ncbi:hypothetical protein WJX73_003918 [Symbiochloris irregularis]|uniref:FAD-binding PCMH-type domain-containing protein n=1 Tax=Symbiochloris irregularis TaxID=706552 RepID=A0AAW1P955_9CHLO
MFISRVACVVLLISLSVHLSAAQATLLDCLNATNATVIDQSSPAYSTQRLVANQRINRTPAAIALPNSAQAVSEIVLCCRKFNVSAVPRSGGHSYEGYSVADNSVVVDMTQGFNFYEPQGDTTAWAGSGIRLGSLYYEAWKEGGEVFPGGTCPDVGLSGLLLGAKGGGGGNFGIVTRMHLQMYPQPNTTTLIYLEWPASEAVQVMQLWQAWAPTAPDAMTSNLQMAQYGVQMHGLYSGPMSEANALLQASGLLNVSGIQYKQYNEQPFIQSALDFGAETTGISTSSPINLMLGPNVTEWHNSWKAGSYDVPTALNSTVLNLMQQAVNQNSNGWIQFSAYGGQISRVPSTASAYAGRYSLYNIQYSIGWQNPSDTQPSMAWFAQLQQTLNPYMVNSAYVNYIDNSLQNWETAYYGDNLQRLQTVKQTWDPTNFWNNPQTIPLP